MTGERASDPIGLQVMAGALRAICDEMGATLVRSAHSANIKERRDASTALFTAAGEMVMQAEHIPVHLGAMPDSVAAVIGREQRPGDVWILNDPFDGGTHLPDISLISPLFIDGRLAGFAANRAHHADVGGATPGSMPPDSHSLADEGVVIAPSAIVREGRLDQQLLASITEQMRNPDQRRADLRAQLAANLLAGRRLDDLSARVGPAGLSAGMEEVLDYAERRTRSAIESIPDGSYSATDVMEDDAGGEHDLEIAVTLRVAGDSIDVDFAGSAPQSQGNLNCPLSVTKSAVYFALRVFTEADIPSCAGAYRPLRISAPAGSLVNAARPAAVAAGNVETSSRIADAAMLAFGQATGGCALGQGTMNNLTLGSDSFAYYETIGGGQGAGPESDGPSAVHVAMSNTLNTPIEALELEFPLRVTEYSLRRGSGGAGRHRGGDGIVREIEALAQLQFSLLTERRRHAPPGAGGGRPGQTGKNLLIGEHGSRALASKAGGTLEPGERLRIETPGGGGYGEPRTTN